MLGDRVGRLPRLSREHRFGKRLRIILRPVSEPLGVGIVIPGTPVVGDAVDDLIANIGMLKPDAHELGVVARADPDRQPTLVDRLRPKIADARAQKADPVLVGIEAGEGFGESFADPVTAVWARHHPVVDLLVAWVKTDGMIARRHDDALDAGASRCFEQIIGADDIGPKDRLPRALARNAAEMDDAVDAVDDALDCSHVEELGEIDFLAGPRRRQRHAIGEP